MNSNTATLNTFQTLRHLYGITFTPMSTFNRLAERYGNVLHLKFGNDAVIFVNDPEVIKYILKTNHENFPRGKAISDLKPLLGEGLFLSEGEHWKSQHKLLQPVFHQHRMDVFSDLLREELRSMVQSFQRHAEAKTAVDLEKEFIALLFSLTIRYLISPKSMMDNDRLIGGLKTILGHTTTMRHYWRQILGILFRRPVQIFDFHKPRKALDDIQHAVDRLFDDVMNGTILPGEFMRVLTDEHKAGRLTAQQVKDEMQTVLFAGYDTVAEGLLWLVYFLSTHPAWNGRITAELAYLAPREEDALISPQETPVMQACIKETLRLMPPAWSFFRTAKESVEFDGYSIPKNTVIMISPYILHRDKTVWPSPETFDPERFLGGAEIHPYRYMPFGQGPHICIGNRLAMTEIHAIAVTLFSRFSFTFESPTAAIPDVTPEAIISSISPVRAYVNHR